MAMAQDVFPRETEERIRGVFSSRVMTSVGFGGTKQKTEKTLLFFVEEQLDGRIGVQPLNDFYVPSGELRFVTKDELLESYLPEPEIYMNKVYPAIRQVMSTLKNAERHLNDGNTFCAEYEFKNALRIDEENIRATFGLGMTYLERGELEKGDLVFRRLVDMRGTYLKRHKHLFNDFGIKLRKCQMYRQALKYYSRAYSLSKDDEHLLYNIARTLYEKGRYKAALVFVQRALRFKTDFELADQLLAILQKKLLKKN
jgi:tetratricopeptide (TPR) repeat protein